MTLDAVQGKKSYMAGKLVGGVLLDSVSTVPVLRMALGTVAGNQGTTQPDQLMYEKRMFARGALMGHAQARGSCDSLGAAVEIARMVLRSLEEVRPM